jgi:micrococcal nuclease
VTLLLALPVRSQEQLPVLVGTVIKIVDGDTIDVQLDSGPIRVRFHGIDTPERDQPWFKESTDALSALIANRQVQIEPFEQDRYERLVGIVFRGDLNVNAELVKRGHAWAFRKYMRKADAALCEDEAAARTAKRGLWALKADQRIAPWEWRRRKSQRDFTDYSRETLAQCVAAIGRRT